MRSRASRRRRFSAATAALALGGLGIVGPASASADPVTATVQQSASAVRSYWTEARMRNAQPASILQSGPPALSRASTPQAAKAPSGKATPQRKTARYPNRTNGKVFLTIPNGADAGDYECSGTAVRAGNRSLVWTAGHCGFDYPEDPFPFSRLDCDCFVTNFEFVPAYNNGAKPYGEWPARNIATTSQWRKSGDSAFDFSAVTVKPRNGKRLQDVVGGRRIAFGQPRRLQYDAFGYPDEPPFDGQHLYRCASGYEGSDDSVGPPSPIRISCDMTAGASGGAWVIKRRHHGHPRHYVASVTSYGYDTDPDHLYGPYQGGVAESLYRAAGG